jgi:PAS domain S-box-containing protein
MGGISVSPTTFARGAVYALLFVVSMQLMVELARAGENVTAIWIASAVLAWALISSSTRDWPVMLGLAGAAHIARAVIVGEQPATELVYLTANLSGPLVCASLLRLRKIDLAFQDRASVFNFLLIAGAIAPAFAAAAAAAGTLVDKSRFEIEDLGIWFLADTLSYVVFLPVIANFLHGNWRLLVRPGIRLRAAVLFSILLAVLVYEWFMPIDLRRAFPILLVPFLIFIVFELGVAGGRAALAITTVSLLLFALFGPGAALPGMTYSGYIVSVQIYIAALVVCILPLAATLAEKQNLYESTSEALEEAQSAWSSLIAAEAHYRLIADNATDLIMRLDLDGVIIFASPACSVISVNVHDLEGKQIEDLAHPDDAGRVRSELAAFIAENAIDQPRTVRTRLRDARDAWRTFDIVSTLVATQNSKVDEVIAVMREVSQ